MTWTKNMTAAQGDRAVMQAAWRAGVIPKPYGYGFGDSNVTPALLSLAEERFARTGSPNAAGREDNGIDPRSLHYVDSSRGRVVHPSESAPFPQWTVELARFDVPRGAVGVIKMFQQYLAQGAILQDPAFVYTQSSRWGIPGPWYTGISNPITDQGVWHFRLIPNTHPIGDWISQTGNFPIPGVPYTDFPQESGLWWPAGSSPCGHVHWLIPSGYTLRVFYVTPAQSARLEVAAKLSGWVQSNECIESTINVRTRY